MQFELVSYPHGKAFDHHPESSAGDGVTTDGIVTGPRARVSSQRIAETLREAILAGEIRPGSGCCQDVIAERFGTSRIPVREAFRMLEAEGLTEVLAQPRRPGAGAGPRAGQHLYRMRERLEPLTLTQSLEHLTDDDGRDGGLQERIEANTDVAASWRWTATSTWRRTPAARASSCCRPPCDSGTPRSTTAVRS